MKLPKALTSLVNSVFKPKQETPKETPKESQQNSKYTKYEYDWKKDKWVP